jgi:hypothetical protein
MSRSAPVVRGPPLHADGFRRRDLNVIDVSTVPDGLEHPVGEPEREQVLNGFLAKVVIDPEDLALVEVVMNREIQPARAGEIGSEGFLDDDTPPSLRGRSGESGGPKALHYGAINRRRDGQIVQDILCTVDLAETGVDSLIEGGIVELAVEIEHARGERGRHLVLGCIDADEFPKAVAKLLPERLVIQTAPRNPEDGEAGRKPIAARQVVDRWQQLASGQVSGGAEDDERARLRGAPHLQPLEQRVLVRTLPVAGAEARLRSGRLGHARGS